MRNASFASGSVRRFRSARRGIGVPRNAIIATFVAFVILGVVAVPQVQADNRPGNDIGVREAWMQRTLTAADHHLSQLEATYDGWIETAGGVALLDYAQLATMADELLFVHRELARLDAPGFALAARVDAQLARLRVAPPGEGTTASLAGTVTEDGTDAPISGALVSLLSTTGGGLVGTATTAADGTYAVTGLAGDTVLVRVQSINEHLEELYDDMPCKGTCDFPAATRIEIPAGGAVEGIDVGLAPVSEIQGRVVTAAEGHPLAFVKLVIQRLDGTFARLTKTDVEGRYRGGILHADNYVVATVETDDYVDLVYDGIVCEDDGGDECAPSVVGTPIAVAVGETVRGIDFALPRGATIGGLVRASDTGLPLGGWTVEIYALTGLPLGSALSDGEGRWSLSGLTGGSYFARARRQIDRPYMGTLYDRVPCPIAINFGACDLDAGTPIVVAADGEVDDIRIDVLRRGSISGRVTDALTGQPLAQVSLQFRDDLGTDPQGVSTDHDGRFFRDDLLARPYRVFTSSVPAGYVGEVYNDVPCDPTCRPELGTPVLVRPGEDTEITIALSAGGRIEGRVTGPGGQPVVGQQVMRLGLDDETSDLVFTEASGAYRFDDVPAGAYRIVASAQGQGLVAEVWDDVMCVGVACTTQGNPVTVAAGENVAGIDFALVEGGRIRGRVTNADTGGVATSVEVVAWDEAGREVHRVGAGIPIYALGVLPTGRYRVGTDGGGDFADVMWPDVPCPFSGCDGTTGDLITLGPGSEINGIDFVVDAIGCDPLSTALCLEGGRFAVDLMWQPDTGGPAPGRAEPLTDDSGYFWFGRRENVEVVVKVLDACSSPSGRFWVFAAGLTNLDVTLRVTDTYTDTVRTYLRPQGVPFAPIQDVQAFDTCDALKHATSTGGAAEPAPPVRAARGLVQSPEGSCVADAQTLCLNQGRFALRSTWRIPNGTTGAGQAVPLTADTGTFWFFRPDNVEMVVKVLDACSTPFARYWVFAGGLTNVEVTLEVTDTQTGDVRRYTNPQGVPFAPLQDTQAFATCP